MSTIDPAVQCLQNVLLQDPLVDFSKAKWVSFPKGGKLLNESAERLIRTCFSSGNTPEELDAFYQQFRARVSEKHVTSSSFWELLRALLHHFTTPEQKKQEARFTTLEMELMKRHCAQMAQEVSLDLSPVLEQDSPFSRRLGALHNPEGVLKQLEEIREIFMRQLPAFLSIGQRRLAAYAFDEALRARYTPTIHAAMSRLATVEKEDFAQLTPFIQQEFAIAISSLEFDLAEEEKARTDRMKTELEPLKAVVDTAQTEQQTAQAAFDTRLQGASFVRRVFSFGLARGEMTACNLAQAKVTLAEGRYQERLAQFEEERAQAQKSRADLERHAQFVLGDGPTRRAFVLRRIACIREQYRQLAQGLGAALL